MAHTEAAPPPACSPPCALSGHKAAGNAEKWTEWFLEKGELGVRQASVGLDARPYSAFS